MSLRSKVWVTVALVCASMAARAEYKEVWNPPEAARKVGHAKPAGSGAVKRVNHAKSVPHAKAATKPVASAKAQPKPKQTHVAAGKTAPAPVHAKHVETAARPHQAAQSNATQAASAQPPRELPPILH